MYNILFEILFKIKVIVIVILHFNILTHYTYLFQWHQQYSKYNINYYLFQLHQYNINSYPFEWHQQQYIKFVIRQVCLKV